MTRKPGLNLIECCIIAVIVVVIAAIAVPGLLSSRRASNERTASTSLKTLASAEADFRSNDRDWNEVCDFWTADVKGLYTMTPANIAGSADASIKLIELKVAASDADGTFFPAGGENAPLSRFAVPASMSGYWSLALLTDQTVKGTVEMTYAVDTKGKPSMGSVHNTSKFGFAAFPDSSSSGKYLFILNENNTIFRQTVTGAREGRDVPPGRKGVNQAWQHWPDDSKPAAADFHCPQ
jgi:type II secretory pathway pseudopilin PulG